MCLEHIISSVFERVFVAVKKGWSVSAVVLGDWD